MILGCRSTQRGEAARKEITDSTGTTPVTVMDIDLSSLASVRAFATAFHERFAKLDVLVNHAATSLPAREVTPEGFERHWATKVLGPHLLTTPLISALRAELLLDEGAELLDLRRVAEAAITTSCGLLGPRHRGSGCPAAVTRRASRAPPGGARSSPSGRSPDPRRPVARR